MTAPIRSMPEINERKYEITWGNLREYPPIDWKNLVAPPGYVFEWREGCPYPVGVRLLDDGEKI